MHEPTATAEPTRWLFDDCELDLSAQRLSRGGVAVPLSPRYFAVLVHLAGSGGRLVSKDELLDRVWGHRNVSDSVLKVAINAVRSALGDDPKAPRHVETVARRGYRFIAQARPAPAAPAVSPGVSAADAARAPGPAPAAAVKGHLPPAQPGLIGREADLLRVRQALAAHPLVTLVGPGGVGKTRLALAAAGADAPPDGVWLLSLDTLASAAPLLATVVRTLGLSPAAGAGAEALARALAGQRLRLLIDNAEHLQPAVAELAAALLAAAPGVQMLVTSQLPLGVAGEQLLPLAPLAVPAADEASPDRSAAVQLLLARARQQQPELPFDAAAAADAAAICRALDGLPLALELAAARVPLLGWAGVRARLGERLSLLTRGRQDAAGRHRSLRAALDWTTALLAPAEQQLLQRLSVFAGSFTVDAALAVAGGDDTTQALDALDALRERSLLVRAAGDATSPRWRLYDSVRSFAAEALQRDGDALAALDRLLSHMIQLFATAEADWAGVPLRPWLARLQPEVDNLRAALQHALADPARQRQAVALHEVSVTFRVRGGWRHEALRDHLQLAALPSGALTPLEQAGLDLAAAQLATIGQVLPPQPALEAARRARATYQGAGDVRREHLALYLISGLLLRLQAPITERAAVLAQMRALEPPSWGPLERRHRVWQEVMLQRDLGDVAAFEERCAAYMATGRALGDDHAAWIASQALAQVMAGQRRMANATALLERTVAEMRRCGELRENAHVLAQWAALRVAQDAEPDTVALLREAARLMLAEDRLWWMADALPWLPAWQGRWHDASRVQAWADELVRRRGDRRGRLFGALRELFEGWLAGQAQAAELQALLLQPPALDEGTVLQTVFGQPP
jgi:predicted ATPase/DNA-binding winged helix-turn-helix (wHTH) protein